MQQTTAEIALDLVLMAARATIEKDRRSEVGTVLVVMPMLSPLKWADRVEDICREAETEVRSRRYCSLAEDLASFIKTGELP